MRAVALESFEAGPVVLDLPTPEPAPGEVLVRVSHTSLNGWDIAVASGAVKDYMEHRWPVVLGKDFAGTVEVVGDEVSSVAVGDEVFGVLGREYVGDGTFADYVVVPESGTTKIPSGLEHSYAGALGLAGAAALASIDAVSPATGQRVLISGATGGVGAQAIQLAANRGAEVIATARPGEETDFVTELGARHTVDYSGDVAAQIRASWPDGVDAAIHLAGDGGELADLVKSGGSFASTLGVGADQLQRDDISATAVMAMPTKEVLDELAAAVAAGKLRVPVGHTYKLEEVPQAITDFAAGTLGKLAVTVD